MAKFISVLFFLNSTININMEENKNVIPEVKKINWNKFHTITNVILIILIVIAIAYIWYNLDYVKLFMYDPCSACELKTNASCIAQQTFNLQSG